MNEPAKSAVPIIKYPGLVNYLKAEATSITQNSFASYPSLGQWEAAKPGIRQKFLGMLGLDPLPERTPLNVQITGVIDRSDLSFRVYKIIFEASRKDYVTCNLYVPKNLIAQAPAILYLCGHSISNSGGGVKATFQHHGTWFAEHGYICLIMDTMFSGEIGPDMHHGVYYYKQYDLYSRGYTPAGPETWHAMRAIDYLFSRQDVDTTRLGVTGMSGGGRMTYALIGADERVKAAVPTVGTCTLDQLVNDQTINENCDCDYWPNIDRLSMPEVYGLFAPKPLLIQNATLDVCYPPKGYLQFQTQVQKVYNLYGESSKLRMVQYPVQHSDADVMRAEEFQFFNEQFMNNPAAISPLVPQTYFTNAELACFSGGIPADQITSTLEKTWAKLRPAPAITTLSGWETYKSATLDSLKQFCFYHTSRLEIFNAPLSKSQVLAPVDNGSFVTETFEYAGEGNYRAWAQLRIPKGGARRGLYVNPLDLSAAINGQLAGTLSALIDSGYAILDIKHRGAVAMADTLPDKWRYSEDWYVLRSAHAIGRSPVSMGVVDVLRAVQLVKADPRIDTANINVCGIKGNAVIALYAAALSQEIKSVLLFSLPNSHLFDGSMQSSGGGYQLVYSGKMKTPYLSNVLKYCDIPQVVAMLSPRFAVLANADSTKFTWAKSMYQLSGYPKNLAFGWPLNGPRPSIAETDEAPFNSRVENGTTVFYSLDQDGRVELRVFDILGRQVKMLVNARQKAGQYTVTWDGTSDTRGAVSHGVYFYQLQVEDAKTVRRLRKTD